jgi:hypothetical protein
MMTTLFKTKNNQSLHRESSQTTIQFQHRKGSVLPNRRDKKESPNDSNRSSSETAEEIMKKTKATPRAPFFKRSVRGTGHRRKRRPRECFSRECVVTISAHNLRIRRGDEERLRTTSEANDRNSPREYGVSLFEDRQLVRWRRFFFSQW